MGSCSDVTYRLEFFFSFLLIFPPIVEILDEADGEAYFL